MNNFTGLLFCNIILIPGGIGSNPRIAQITGIDISLKTNDLILSFSVVLNIKE